MMTTLKAIRSSFVAFTLLALVLSGTVWARPPVPGVPTELKGFRGMMSGVLVDKGDGAFHFKVGKILKTWKKNEAEAPERAVGKTIVLNLKKISDRHGAKILGNYKNMRIGDHIELEAFDLGEETLSVLEWLQKSEAKKRE